MKQHPSLRRALADFRAAWEEGLPEHLHETAEHVEPGDALGDPAMTERFRRFISGGLHTPMRRAMRKMSYGTPPDRAAARYLFVLACRHYDAETAGLSMQPPIMPEYVGWYAERVIRRAFGVAEHLDDPEPRRRECAAAGCTTLTDRRQCWAHRGQA